VHDIILLGGGLANSLIALRLRTLRPDLRVLLVERGATLGAAHTWSFFDTDVTPEQREWLEPLVVHRWPGYRIRFPGLDRRLGTPYQSLTSERLHAGRDRGAGPPRDPLNAEVARVEPDARHPPLRRDPCPPAP
jgi:lycopene beta-cyclase